MESCDQSEYMGMYDSVPKETWVADPLEQKLSSAHGSWPWCKFRFSDIVMT